MARIRQRSPRLPSGQVVLIEQEAGYFYVALQEPDGARAREDGALQTWYLAQSRLWETYYRLGGLPPEIKTPRETTMHHDRLDTLIDAELDRLGWSSTTAPEGNSTLDAWNTPATEADGIVTVHDAQEVTRFQGQALLETLRTLPDGIAWDDLWQEIVPHMVHD